MRRSTSSSYVMPKSPRSLLFSMSFGVDDDDDLHVVHQLLEHADLGVGLETGQHARGMVVVEQLAAELQVQLAAELVDAVADVLGLQRDVLVVVESLAHGRGAPFGRDSRVVGAVVHAMAEAVRPPKIIP